MSKITSPNLKKALNDLTVLHPFWASLVLNYEFKEVKGNKDFTFSVDGKTIRYNPAFCEKVSVAVNMFALAHEAGHPMLDHLNRIFTPRPGDGKIYGYVKGKPMYWDPKLWNVAGDYIINSMLKASGFTLWNKCLIDAKYDHATMTTDEVYRALDTQYPQQNKPKPNNSQEDDNDGDKSPDGSGGGGSSPTQQDGDEQDSGSGDSEGTPDSGGSSSQGGSDGEGEQEGSGVTRPGCPDTDPIGGDDIEAPAEGFSQQEQREMVIRAAAIAKAQGKLPASIEGVIKEATEPQYPVYMLLERFIDMNIHSDDSSWKRPHRDFFSRGIILPSDYSETLSHVIVIYDTSGSVPDADLSRFHKVGGDIIRRLKPAKLSIMECDAEVHKITEVKAPSDWPREIRITGRGGTSFRPPFEAIKKLRTAPTCVVYLTDMYGDFPEYAPRYPVLWVSTTKDMTAPFGTTVYMNQ